MIRFIHAADAHIDSPLRGLDAHDAAPLEILRGSTRKAFENLIQLAVDENIDFVVLAGDLYDGDWKDYSTGLFFRGQMARLRDRGIPVYLVVGNHDAASVISRKLSLPDNVHVCSTRTAESREVAGRPVVIHGRGFPNRAVPENLSLDYPDAVPNRFNIGLLHTSLTGRAGHDTYAPCSEADLVRKGYDYWALGHVHQPEVVSRDPWIVFAGNLQGRDIRETGPRGCRLVTVNDQLKVESAEHHDLDVVRWRVLEVDLGGVDESSEALSRAAGSMAGAVREADGRLVAARIVLTGASPLHGSLHREAAWWRAELLGRAQEQGPEALWIEQIHVATSPVYDPGKLAERDELTRIVLEVLGEATVEPAGLPREVKDMLDVLPGEVRSEVESQWDGAGSASLLEDVKAIILDALGTKGGQVP
ncbi:MAG: DNA repair exonuclease [Syntrophobacteraceae bacterium]|jgi:predicted phosphodiesterase|nr:DNA repair exonuclease [Syntrophobacteraceae bacterium]